MPRPLTRTKKTLRRMGPLTRAVAEIQNDLVALARKLDRLQARVSDAELAAIEWDAHRRRLQPETEEMLRSMNAEKAKEVREILEAKPFPYGGSDNA